jgi:hypothetical protein
MVCTKIGSLNEKTCINHPMVVFDVGDFWRAYQGQKIFQKNILKFT